MVGVVFWGCVWAVSESANLIILNYYSADSCIFYMPLCKNKKRHLSFVTKVAFSQFFSVHFSKLHFLCLYLLSSKNASKFKQPNKTVSFCSVYDNKKKKMLLFFNFCILFIFLFSLYGSYPNKFKCA